MLFLNNTVSSDGYTIFMMLTASIIILFLSMKKLRWGFFGPFLKFSDKLMTVRTTTQVSWFLAQNLQLSYLDFPWAFDKVPHEKVLKIMSLHGTLGSLAMEREPT